MQCKADLNCAYRARQMGRDTVKQWNAVLDGCITYEFIDAAGRYHGGNISPGVQMRFRALHEFTGRLPLVLREGRRLPLGSDTDTAMREGVLKGMEYEISGYITVRSEERRVGKECRSRWSQYH